jgi:predicted nucleotidyltransferase
VKLPKHQQQILTQIVQDLQQINGVAAVVLGGSHAAGAATGASDMDVGIYYSANKPFDIAEIKAVARKYAADPPAVTGFYEWGPWVNGGAWIITEHGKVDFLYRNIEQVTQTIEKAKKGEWENHFEQQPPYGFSSVIYLAETEICIPLYDPEKVIERLKLEVQQYPQQLREAIIKQSLWSAEFTIMHADGFWEKEDVYNTVGCLTRAVKSIVSALFAINERYALGDKRAIERLEEMARKPVNLKARIETILCADKKTMLSSIESLKALHEDVVRLSDGIYKPLYQLKH